MSQPNTSESGNVQEKCSKQVWVHFSGHKEMWVAVTSQTKVGHPSYAFKWKMRPKGNEPPKNVARWRKKARWNIWPSAWLDQTPEKLRFNTLKLHMGYEVHRIGRMGILNVHWNIAAWAFSLFASIWQAASQHNRLQTGILCLSSTNGSNTYSSVCSRHQRRSHSSWYTGHTSELPGRFRGGIATQLRRWAYHIILAAVWSSIPEHPVSHTFQYLQGAWYHRRWQSLEAVLGQRKSNDSAAEDHNWKAQCDANKYFYPVFLSVNLFRRYFRFHCPQMSPCIICRSTLQRALVKRNLKEPRKHVPFSLVSRGNRFSVAWCTI